MEEDQQQSRVEGTKGIASSRVGQLAKEFEHVSKRQRTCIAKAQSELDDLIEYLEGLKKDLSKESSPLNAKEAFGLIQKQVRDKQDKIAKEQKDFHASLSKFGKLVDKVISFIPDNSPPILSYSLPSNIHTHSLLSLSSTSHVFYLPLVVI
eukprot:GEZU01011978.1.p1 GENE.GEZU01011978.1~~GEZU01011978.1.p1  ORF type:complete len:151 (-),score=19.23 GEZU01011978.1:198-650(-)